MKMDWSPFRSVVWLKSGLKRQRFPRRKTKKRRRSQRRKTTSKQALKVKVRRWMCSSSST